MSENSVEAILRILEASRDLLGSYNGVFVVFMAAFAFCMFACGFMAGAAMVKR